MLFWQFEKEQSNVVDMLILEKQRRVLTWKRKGYYSMNDDKNMELNEEDVVINPNNYAKYGIKKKQTPQEVMESTDENSKKVEYFTE